jgi:hypothetical protein
MLKSEGRIRIIKGRGKPLRFEPHAFGHVVQPKAHWVAKDPKVDAACLEIGRE